MMKSEYVRCTLCGHDDWLVRFPSTLNGSEALDVSAFSCTSSGYGQHSQIVQCRYCGYVYANPRWVGPDLLDAYEAVEDETYVNERQGRVLTFRRHLQALERHTGPGAGHRLLDVGAYVGVFVEVAREAGWDACGVEPSQWAVNVARRRGVPVIQGTQASLAGQGQSYDVITMWDVIEHVEDPFAELAQAYRLLKPGGLLAVHTMDIESPVARLLGRRWPWLMGMHIHYFSQRTLAQMLQKVGFTILASNVQGRYLRLGYLASRLQALVPGAGAWARRLVVNLGLEGVPVPVNLGDLFTIYAQKRHGGIDDH